MEATYKLALNVVFCNKKHDYSKLASLFLLFTGRMFEILDKLFKCAVKHCIISIIPMNVYCSSCYSDNIWYTGPLHLTLKYFKDDRAIGE